MFLGAKGIEYYINVYYFKLLSIVFGSSVSLKMLVLLTASYFLVDCLIPM